MKAPDRIIDALANSLDAFPDRTALVDRAGSWTYRQFGESVERAQGWLHESGVRAGDRVMVVCENCRALAALIFAISALEAWPVPVNARLSAREIDEIRNHCGARRAIYTAAVSPHAKQHAQRDGAQIMEVGALGSLAINQLDADAIPQRTDGPAAEQVAVMLYTSGTTGRAKGVMLTHRNVLFIAAAASQIRSVTPDDRVYSVLPTSHSVGFSVNLLGTILSGASLVFAPRFDPVAAQRDIEEHRLSIMLGVPSMYSLWAEYAKMKGIRSFKFPSLRVISSSGAPLGLETKLDIERLFGLTLCNGYGITECSPTIAQVRLEAPRTDTSVGPPLPGVEVKIVGPSGAEVGNGEVGELWVRGPNVMKGYYRAPEETAAVINSEGWFNTRDLARLEGGNLFIVGRTKELIVRFGFNVYPAEVENVLNSHPAVARSAVVGRKQPGTEGGEEVVAFIQLEENAGTTIAEISAHAARHLAAYKVPSEIVLLREMPMTASGKIRKDQLTRIAAGNPDAAQ